MGSGGDIGDKVSWLATTGTFLHEYREQLGLRYPSKLRAHHRLIWCEYGVHAGCFLYSCWKVPVYRMKCFTHFYQLGKDGSKRY